MQTTMPLGQTPGQLLTGMRAKNPLVQNITNFVAMNIAANVMLAAGASPAMVHTKEEAGEFARIAAALTINIGTLSPDFLAGMKAAAAAASEAGKPWVLDPVAHYATSYRRAALAELMELKPTVIRGNASEIIALSGSQSSGHGVDSGDSVAAAEERRLRSPGKTPVSWPSPARWTSSPTAADRCAFSEVRP